MVSRKHVEFVPEDGGWIVRDLGSINGTFLDGQRITERPMPVSASVRLGASGPELRLQVRLEATPVRHPSSSPPLEPEDRAEQLGHFRPSSARGETGSDIHEGPRPSFTMGREHATPEEVAEHYISDAVDDEDIGEHTRMIRRVYREQKLRQKRRWLYVVAGLAVLLVAAIGALTYQWMSTERSRQLAIDQFYDIKALQLDLARLEASVRAASEYQLLEQVHANRARIREMRDRYQRIIDEAGLRDPDLGDVDQLILKVASIFGECELNVPPGFAEEVKAYIKKWQATDRLSNAIRRIQDKNLLDVVARALRQNGLPPQFLYLGLQESNLDPNAIGPPTRFGIAKGAWQFIPLTAEDYGIRVGPLKDEPVYDPDDERFDFEALTWAAARFLSDIYNTDAQASGLLVMASYNWGPSNMIQRIRSMPDNPRERNFWALLQKHDIPKETYDYVLFIVSAAVIGENPRLFGFDFDNPLAGQE
jgi:hypothetical protein